MWSCHLFVGSLISQPCGPGDEVFLILTDEEHETQRSAHRGPQLAKERPESHIPICHSPSSGSNYSVFLVYVLPETMQQSYIIFKWQIFLVLTLAEDCGKIYSKGKQRIWHLQCPVTWGRVQWTKNQPCTANQVFSNYLFSKQLIRRKFLRAPLNFSSVHAIFTFPLSCFPSIFLPGVS